MPTSNPPGPPGNEKGNAYYEKNHRHDTGTAADADLLRRLPEFKQLCRRNRHRRLHHLRAHELQGCQRQAGGL